MGQSLGIEFITPNQQGSLAEKDSLQETLSFIWLLVVSCKDQQVSLRKWQMPSTNKLTKNTLHDLSPQR